MEKKTTSRFRQFINLPIELVQNRTLIGNLAKNDFKTRFAGSYLGVIWAFVQPIVTVVVYWFVFTVGLRQGRPSGHPFVLWLMAGLVSVVLFFRGVERWNKCIDRVQLSGKESCI